MKIEGAVCVWLDHVTDSNNPTKKKHVNYSGSSTLELFLCCNDQKLRFEEIHSGKQHVNLFSNGKKVYGYTITQNTENAVKISSSKCSFDEDISFEKAVKKVIQGIEVSERASEKKLDEGKYFLSNSQEIMPFLRC